MLVQTQLPTPSTVEGHTTASGGPEEDLDNVVSWNTLAEAGAIEPLGHLLSSSAVEVQEQAAAGALCSLSDRSILQTRHLG